MKLFRPDSFHEYQELSQAFEDFDFSTIEIRPSIDVLKFSVRFKHLSSSKVVPFLLEKKFEIEFSHRGEGFQTVQAKKLVEGQWLGIFCRINYGKFRTTFEIKNPTKEHFNYLYGFLSFPDYSLSEAEYSLDLYGCDNGEMFGFLASHASLRNPGKHLRLCKDTTQYLNDVRANNKYGCKIYMKPPEDVQFVRAEMTVKHRAFEDLGVGSVYDATQLDAGTVFNKFQVENIDYERLFGNLGLPEYQYEDFEGDFFKAMNGNANCGGLPAVKKLISSLKDYPYNYYKKHPFHGAFHNAIKGIKFV